MKRAAVKRRNAVDPLTLQTGDYVVHAQHGIGKFVEMTQRTTGTGKAATTREYLVLEYSSSKRGQASDRLFVPTDQLDQVSRYVGGELPTLNKLGGSDWSKTKSKARKAVRDIAASLVQLYAARQAAPGHAFAPDTPWQREMEDSFPFTETPDQASAIDEVKADMEKAVPMDRVISGDVGYGKTEIGVRAAFKAVQDGKQVAVLVPTTLLAQQHLQTFTERMQNFPVTVKGLSRFTVRQGGRRDDPRAGRRDRRRRRRDPPAAADRGHVEGPRPRDHRRGAALRRRAQGAHHRAAGPRGHALDVRDADPAHAGDEPRRHPGDVDDPHPARGAAPDAHLRRRLRREAGRRRDPPRAAARRAGLLHPQPRVLDRRRGREAAPLVPEARIATAHGQMAEERLERTVNEFWEREHDVLVCTTIVENGLDISNANTLIVERSDTLGLCSSTSCADASGAAASGATPTSSSRTTGR